MKLAFHYHINLVNKYNSYYLPGYFGIFIDELAKQVDELTLLFFEANEKEIQEADYELTAKNIKWLNMGPHKPAWYRSLNYRQHLAPLKKVLDDCDIVIVRGPTPLAPYFKKYVSTEKLVYMVVGDYKEGAKQFKVNGFRDWVITWYLKHNDYLFRKALKNNFVLVNSTALLETYQHLTPQIHLIKTTTLRLNDFYNRNDTCQNKNINILYTGRIDRAKGLFELLEAIAILKDVNYKLNIVGWELGDKKIVTQELINLAELLGITDQVIFHGKKNIGEELNSYYRMSDIYVIPTHFEGFPRTIWEAMANSLPVIATKVGGIPHHLTHLKNAVLINPKQTNEIKLAIQNLVNDSTLRQNLIKTARTLAEESTLEIQTKKLVNLIKEHLIND
jgi:glycosyltransferase involved in cell wall biosynthesis